MLGVWNNVAAFEDYWTARERERVSDVFGEDWTVCDAARLKELVARGEILLVECVDLTRSNRRFQDACSGWDGDAWAGLLDRFQAAIDVHRARRAVPPVITPE